MNYSMCFARYQLCNAEDNSSLTCHTTRCRQMKNGLNNSCFLCDALQAETTWVDRSAKYIRALFEHFIYKINQSEGSGPPRSEVERRSDCPGALRLAFEWRFRSLDF